MSRVRARDRAEQQDHQNEGDDSEPDQTQQHATVPARVDHSWPVWIEDGHCSSPREIVGPVFVLNKCLVRSRSWARVARLRYIGLRLLPSAGAEAQGPRPRPQRDLSLIAP